MLHTNKAYPIFLFLTEHHRCYFDDGYNYRGYLAKTVNNNTCALWTHSNNGLYDLYTDGVGVHNFCRNPGLYFFVCYNNFRTKNLFFKLSTLSTSSFASVLNYYLNIVSFYFLGYLITKLNLQFCSKTVFV